jgi:hypothetical protein
MSPDRCSFHTFSPNGIRGHQCTGPIVSYVIVSMSDYSVGGCRHKACCATHLSLIRLGIAIHVSEDNRVYMDIQQEISREEYEALSVISQ